MEVPEKEWKSQSWRCSMSSGKWSIKKMRTSTERKYSKESSKNFGAENTKLNWKLYQRGFIKRLDQAEGKKKQTQTQTSKIGFFEIIQLE